MSGSFWFTKMEVSKRKRKVNRPTYLIVFLIFLIVVSFIVLIMKTEIDMCIVDTNSPGFVKKGKHQRIFDTWMYNNEAEMAYIRIWRLYDYVDYFIIVVSNYTHTGMQKIISFRPFTKDLEKYQSKIRIVYVDGVLCDNVTYPHEDYPWCVEKTQRDYAVKYIEQNFQPTEDDLILISDADEIWTRKSIKFISEHPPKFYYFVRGNVYFPYYFHYQEKWDVGIVCRYIPNMLLYATPSQIRQQAYNDHSFLIGTDDIFITHCSWCFKNINHYKRKLMSFAHTEFNRPPFTTDDWIFASHYCRSKINSPDTHYDENRTDLNEMLPFDQRLRHLFDKSYRYNLKQTNYKEEDLKTLCEKEYDRTPFKGTYIS